jgi:broad specificity phosphatase PhoE
MRRPEPETPGDLHARLAGVARAIAELLLKPRHDEAELAALDVEARGITGRECRPARNLQTAAPNPRPPEETAAVIRKAYLPGCLLLACLPFLPMPARAQARGDSTVVILVRHAEKAAAGGGFFNSNPPLTPAGERRARDLYAIARRYGVDAIFVTQFQRTRQTAAPTAKGLRLTPRMVPMLGGEVLARETVDSIFAHHAGQTVLVVGHQTSIPRMVELLGGPVLGDICSLSYSNLFIVVLSPGRPARVARTHYGAADPADEPGCIGGLRR